MGVKQKRGGDNGSWVTKGDKYPYASLSCFRRGVPHAGNTIELFVKEHHVRYFTELGTLPTDVLFDI